MDENIKQELGYLLNSDKEFADHIINDEQYWEERKKELREEIIKYRDTPLNELINDELLKTGFYAFETYLRSKSDEIILGYYLSDKEGKGPLSRRYGYPNIIFELKTYNTYSTAYYHYIQEIIDNHKKEEVKLVVEKKEKYQNVSNEKLAQYLELLVYEEKIKKIKVKKAVKRIVVP